MRQPIQYALSYPETWGPAVPRLDLARLASLSFEPPDLERFPCLALAFATLRAGGTAPAVYNAANETANLAFREGRIGFTRIPALIRDALNRHETKPARAIEDVLDCDRRTRADVLAAIA